ncbi:AbrB/MazE/SpoVT family DNA-binding domain-containing protein [Lacrimispora sp.]|jgi:transcriptional pleiotropic regulator of transition state genes|uniref:AbrB/MazE/SpoVT family DNA-binding domain-containing protein n=1 Tax=Lacrimispora sp. TaxID=2719234 RepID=UPI0029E57C66|nr:AbrB family transcriptional regulator, transcriptional pleiotropic regulator of transition state [Lacrimispora sp.]
MTRKVDELGCIVLPIEYRQTLNISEKDELEITLDFDKITIRKPIMGCHFCQSAVALVRIGRECVCRECIQRLQNATDGEVLFPTKIESI